MPPIEDILAVLRTLTDEPNMNMRTDPFRVLIGCILSQRTRDSNSEAACNNLFSVARTPEQILELEVSTVQEKIRCSGFYNQKTNYILKTCQQIVSRHNGKVPRNRNELLSLHGVGHKTADIVLSFGFGESIIPVDVHVSRVSRRLGLADPMEKPETVKERLEDLITCENRLLYDHGVLIIGKTYCRKTNPKCSICPLEKFCMKNFVNV